MHFNLMTHKNYYLKVMHNHIQHVRCNLLSEKIRKINNDLET